MNTAVTDRLVVTREEAKLHLRVDHDDEDELIAHLIESAKQSADRFLNNPFEDQLGVPQEIPADVKTWVLRRVAFLYEQRVENVVADTVPGAGTVDYGRSVGSQQAGALDYSLIRPYRLNPGL